MEIKATDLRNALMAAIDRINVDEDAVNPISKEQMEIEIQKAKAISELADKIIDLAKCENQHNAILLKQRQLESNGKLDGRDKPLLPNVGFFALKS